MACQVKRGTRLSAYIHHQTARNWDSLSLRSDLHLALPPHATVYRVPCLPGPRSLASKPRFYCKSRCECIRNFRNDRTIWIRNVITPGELFSCRRIKLWISYNFAHISLFSLFMGAQPISWFSRWWNYIWSKFRSTLAHLNLHIVHINKAWPKPSPASHTKIF